MTQLAPCNICGSSVRLVEQEMPRRLGESQARIESARKCTSTSCPSNTGTRRLGDTV